MNNKINKIREHKDICTEIHEMYIKKNADYGDSVGELYSKLGDISLLTRISDKHSRLLNMFSNPDKEINFESADDTIEDMANYCMIWLMERRIKRMEENQDYGVDINPKGVNIFDNGFIHPKPVKMPLYGFDIDGDNIPPTQYLEGLKIAILDTLNKHAK